MSGMTDVDGWMRDVADAAASLDKRGDRQMSARLMRLHRDMDVARLRGDGKQGQAVAWIKPDWSDPKNFDGKSPVTTYPQLGWTPLYIHPQSAPSEQVAASVVVPDEATIDRLAHEAYEIHCNTPIGHFPNDSKFPKWRAVVRHVLAAAPVAPINNNKEDNAAH